MSSPKHASNSSHFQGGLELVMCIGGRLAYPVAFQALVMIRPVLQL